MTSICIACLQDPYLRQKFSGNTSASHPCEYCEAESPGVPLFDIAWACDEVIDTHFEPSHYASAVVLFDRDPAGNDLEGTLRGLNAVSENALNDLLEDLNGIWFDRDSMESKYGDEDPWFKRKADMSEPLSSAWIDMEKSLHQEARYLNPMALRVLEDVLGSLASDCTEDGHSVIIAAGHGAAFDRLYRARVFQTEKMLEEALCHPEKLLGTPAAGSGPAGRMNAKGQPAFYGATSPAIAVAEVRPPVGSRVAVAAFDIVRPLRLLDLRSLARVQLDASVSLFDPRSIAHAQRRDFLRVLSQVMVAPVMPELQDRDYLITQVVADYLATHPSGEIDGIVYPSTQVGGSSEHSPGSNVVLFSKASRVRNAEAEVTGVAHLWDYEPDGSRQYFQPEIWVKPKEKDTGEWPSPPENWPALVPAMGRKISLELVRDQIEIHDVRAVYFETQSTKVGIHAPRIEAAPRRC